MSIHFKGFTVGHGDVRLPDWLLEMDISKGAKLTYNVLAICSRGHDFTWASQAFLAGKISSSIRTVQRHLAELIKHGLIEKGREYAKGKMRGVYRFLTAPLKHDNLSHCPSEPKKILSQNTTICRAKSDILSCSLIKEETINKNKYSPAHAEEFPVAPVEGPGEVAGEEGGLFLESKEEEAEWFHAKKLLEADLSPGSFQTWIVPLLFERNGSAVILRGQNDFFCKWVKNHFGAQIERALAKVSLTEWRLDIFTPEQQKADAEQKARAAELQKEAARAAAKVAAPPDEDVDSLPLDEQFGRLYAVYPRNYEAADEAWDAFYKLHRLENFPKTSVLIAAVKRAKNSNPSWQKDDGQYVPQLKKWLGKRRWLD